MTYETRAVLAAAYPRYLLRKFKAPFLTHAVSIDEEGTEFQVLCGRVEINSIADAGAADTTKPPTCKVCAGRLKKLRGLT